MNNYLVYVVNFPNDKAYVGITCRDLQHRKKEHYRASRKQAINHALKLYQGQETWSIVCSGLTKEQACEKEISLIELWETKAPYGYNLTRGGEGIVGRVITRAHRLNYRKSKKNIEVFYGGQKIDEVEMQKDAAQKYDLSVAQVNGVIKGRYCTANGYSFKFSGEDFTYVKKPRKKQTTPRKPVTQETRDKQSRSLTGIKRTPEQIERSRIARAGIPQTIEHRISVARALFNGTLVLTKDEIVKTYLSIFECCRDLGFSSQSINTVLNPKTYNKSLHGYAITKIPNSGAL